MEGHKLIFAAGLDDSGLLGDVEDPDVDAAGLHGVIVKVGVRLLPGLADDLAELGEDYMPSKERGCTTWF